MLHDPKNDRRDEAPSWHIVEVHPKAFKEVWPQVRDLVLRALKHGAGDTLTEGELIRGLTHGSMQMWAVQQGDGPVTAAMIWQVENHERGKVVQVLAMVGAGYRDYAPEMQRLLMEYAILIGAYTIEASVRDAAVPIVRALGWRRKATLMECPIDGR